MATYVFANEASTSVTAGGTTTSDTSFTVSSSASFPALSAGQQFAIVDRAAPSEVMLVTAVSGTTWTVTRAAEGSAAITHSTPWTADLVITEGFLSALAQGTSSGASVLGDGSDGALTFDGTATVTLPDGSSMAPTGSVYLLSRDIYASAITINSGVTLQVHGYRIFCSGTLTCNGTISSDGGAASGATGGASTSYNTLIASGVGASGGTGAGAAGGAPPTGNTLGSPGGSGGTGNGGANAGGGSPTGGSGSASAWVVRPPGVFQYGRMNLGGTLYYAPAPGGGAGGGDGTSSGGGGGGGGGIVVIWAKAVANNGTISARGGAGGNATAGNCGGGGGGGGGIVVLYTLSAISGTGTTTVAGGAAGTGTGTGTAGSAGSTGLYANVVLS